MSKSKRTRSPFRVTEIPPAARWYQRVNTRNGIVARLYHFMTHSREIRQGKSVTVPVPSTTAAEGFRSYLVNWMRKRKNFRVSTHVISEHEISVWMRKEQSSAPTVPPPWHLDAVEPLVRRKHMSERKRKQYRPRAGVPTESMPFDTAIAVTDALGFAPLWPAGDAAAD